MAWHNGLGSAVSMAEGGSVGALLQRDYSTGIASEASSSCPASDARRRRVVSGLAAAGDGAWRGGHGGGGDVGADLELGLSLGAAGAAGRNAARGGGAPWPRDCCRILTAKDFPSVVASRGSPISSSSSSSASSSPSPGGGDGGGGGGRGSIGVSGTKRSADPVAPEIRCRLPTQVVGWPPIRAYRINSLMNHSKNNSDDDEDSDDGHQKKAICPSANVHSNGIKQNATGKKHEKQGPVSVGGSLFVKVNMDGMPIGRKVDLNAHRSYETLALALDDMFQKPGALSNPIKSVRISKLLDGCSEFVLTYEDKDGDWLLAGDVPWGMFLNTVKRLRIMRTSDANGLSRCQDFQVCLRNNPMQHVQK